MFSLSKLPAARHGKNSSWFYWNSDTDTSDLGEERNGSDIKCRNVWPDMKSQTVSHCVTGLHWKQIYTSVLCLVFATAPDHHQAVSLTHVEKCMYAYIERVLDINR